MMSRKVEARSRANKLASGQSTTDERDDAGNVSDVLDADRDASEFVFRRLCAAAADVVVVVVIVVVVGVFVLRRRCKRCCVAKFFRRKSAPFGNGVGVGVGRRDQVQEC